ncbi:proline dehydrogenase [Tripterygium wilfordii]|uniref:Proline dehydrogenase n=1 Tax=Tripterygium wilfordii TaxID=458696 RepID=A0A7J7DRV6_TRIWF|nr:proline dehydrogenase 2, mitochondrial-like [Tripterygium wilfordii]KAF5748884.1 proline dehydrogenase [Tripterygium wilfordii]
MATRVIPPKLLRSVTRPRTSATTTALPPPYFTAHKLQPSPQLPTLQRPGIVTRLATPTASSVLNLDDHEKIFSSLSTVQLLRSSAILQMAATEPVVDLGLWVMRSQLMEIKGVRDVLLSTIKHSFYEHFCAGEDAKEAKECLLNVNESGLRGMLVYGVEHTCDVDACDRNLNGFTSTVDIASSLPKSSTSYVVVKITAIVPLDLLERVSDLLRWQQRDPSFNLPWKLDSFPVFSESSPLYHTMSKPEPLTPQEEQNLKQGHERLLKLCQRCVEASVPLVVDAEDTQLQPAIDYLTYSSAIVHKNADNPVLYGTIQAYLKDAKDRLLLVSKAAEKMGVPIGFKLVRGAYMSSETKLANSLGFDSPIHNSIQETHDCYNDCASFMLDKIADNASTGVILATHNVESGKLAATKARDLGIKRGNGRLEFAQLYGMSDALSYGLSNAGFHVSKYMPYGPVDVVMPYLLRRAEENRGMLSSSSLDRHLMRKELVRRIKAAALPKFEMQGYPQHSL